jgi:signal transduction histidine kinase
MHRLLERQLQQARRGTAEGGTDFETLVGLVDSAYLEFDRQRRVLAHTHEIMRDEYGRINAGLSRLRDAVTQMGAGFAIWDIDDRLALCNARLREILPQNAERLRPGVAFAECVANMPPRFDSLDGHVAPRDWVAERIARHRQPGGEPFEAVFADGRHVRIWEAKTSEGGIVGVYVDITEVRRAESELRRAKETAEAANRSKSVFLANMSHELRTPLNAIIGFSEVMLTEMLGPLGDRRYCEYARDIHNAGKHLLEVIGDLLDMSKIESGKFELDPEWFDLGELIDSVLRIVRDRAGSAGLSLEVDAADLPSVLGERRVLRQVLLNLIGNAIKFTPSGGSIEVVVQRLTEGGLILRVTDTGIGIAPENIARALQPFGQIERAMSRDQGGVGLGLPLSQRLVELHGGRLEINSTVGAGTTVSVRLPADRIGQTPVRRSA